MLKGVIGTENVCRSCAFVGGGALNGENMVTVALN